MATSSVSTHQTRIESQIDDRQRLRELQAEMEADARTRALTKLQFAALLGEIIHTHDPAGTEKRLAFMAVEAMTDEELEAWLDEAQDDWAKMSREDSFAQWQLQGTLIQHAEHMLYNSSTSATGEGYPYEVTAQPSGPRTRPTHSPAVA
jgi:hypothetical protein